ncbi:HAD family hydrolase [Streptomyces sp. NPDC002523]
MTGIAMERPNDESPDTNFAAVVFDLNGTLVPLPPPAIADAALDECARLLSLEPASFRPRWKASFRQRNAGLWGHTGEEFFTRFLAEMGVSRPQRAIARAAEARRAFARRTVIPPEDTRACLTRLRSRGLPLAVLTVCGPALPEVWGELQIAPLVDHVEFSCLSGLMKPDIRCYTRTCQAISTPPRQCLFIGDGAGGELSGAARAGLTPVLLESTDSRVAGWAPTDWRGARIRRIADLCCPSEAGRRG